MSGRGYPKANYRRRGNSPTFHLEVYCSSLGGIRGGRSGVNDTASPARGAAADPPPVEGSPPDVSITTFGVMYSLAAWRRPPSPLPKSAARPPWARPAAISFAALSVFSASESLYGMRYALGTPFGRLSSSSASTQR